MLLSSGFGVEVLSQTSIKSPSESKGRGVNVYNKDQSFTNLVLDSGFNWDSCWGSLSFLGFSYVLCRGKNLSREMNTICFLTSPGMDFEHAFLFRCSVLFPLIFVFFFFKSGTSRTEADMWYERRLGCKDDLKKIDGRTNSLKSKHRVLSTLNLLYAALKVTNNHFASPMHNSPFLFPPRTPCISYMQIP